MEPMEPGPWGSWVNIFRVHRIFENFLSVFSFFLCWRVLVFLLFVDAKFSLGQYLFTILPTRWHFRVLNPVCFHYKMQPWLDVAQIVEDNPLHNSYIHYSISCFDNSICWLNNIASSCHIWQLTLQVQLLLATKIVPLESNFLSLDQTWKQYWNIEKHSSHLDIIIK